MRGRRPPAEPAHGRGVLPGVGVGIFLVTLLAAILVVVAARGATPRGVGTGGLSEAGTTPDGLHIVVQMAKLDQRYQPGQQINVFEVGDVVGGTVTAGAAPAHATTIEPIWLRVNGDEAIPIVDQGLVHIAPGAAAQSRVFDLAGAPAGVYVFMVVQPGQGSELHKVAVQRFFIQ